MAHDKTPALLRFLRSAAVLGALLAPPHLLASPPAPAPPVAAPAEVAAPALPEPSRPGPDTPAARSPDDVRLPGDRPSSLEGEGSLLGALVRLVLVLALVVALIYLTLHVAGKKLLALQPMQHALVKVHDRYPLEPKKSLYVVEVADEFLLVGVGEREITLLSRLDGERTKTALEQRTAQRAQIKPFWERLTVKPPTRKPGIPGDDTPKA